MSEINLLPEYAQLLKTKEFMKLICNCHRNRDDK